MGGLDRPVPEPEVLRALAERNLVFELMAHPDQLKSAATQLARYDDLTVVVEHTGWPRSSSDDEVSLWKAGMDALAAGGPNLMCKLSGLAMPLGSVKPEILAPWLEYALEAFGVDRCLFASNFPVDSVCATFDELYTAYSSVTESLGQEARAKLFADNAERVYRI